MDAPNYNNDRDDFTTEDEPKSTSLEEESSNEPPSVLFSSPRSTLQVIVIGLILSFVLFSFIDHPRWNWADRLGYSVGTILLSIVFSSAFIGLKLLFTSYRLSASKSKFSQFIAAIGFPMLMIIPILLIRQNIVCRKQAEELREYDKTLRRGNTLLFRD